MTTVSGDSLRVLAVNAGSSSVKLRLLDVRDELVDSVDLATSDGQVDAAAVRGALDSMGPADAVGHRIVHGGTEFTAAVRIDREVERRLKDLVDLAPLHQPAALALLAAIGEARPDLPAVACFDTAFHAAIPAAASTYALPREWREKWALRRYGFHGLSHAYAARRTRALLRHEGLGFRIVTCHLGAGCSLAAVIDDCSVDTTMGFTPLEGLVMATRSGSVDPGLVLWLQQHCGMPPDELASTLEHRSGLLGLAGTSDMRVILDRLGTGDAAAGLAIGVYVHRLRAGIAAMSAAMNGLDALVFTGGVGEHAPVVRQLAAEGLGFLGVALDTKRNAEGQEDREIGRDDASVRTFVVASREDVEIAGQVRALMRP